MATQYTKVEIEEYLQRMTSNESPEAFTEDATVLHLVAAYRIARGEFDSARSRAKALAVELRSVESDVLRLEGKTNATASLLRAFYEKSLNQENPDDRSSEADDGDDQAPVVEVAGQPVHGAENRS